MFFNGANFKTLEAGTQMAWMQQQMHSHNLGNVETPGYKSKKLEFKQIFDTVKSGEVELSSIQANVVTDESTSGRPDGNNVDFEAENIAMYQSYVQYSMLLEKVTGKFDNYSYVLNNSAK